MAWQFTAYSIPPLVAALVSLSLAAVAWRHREKPVGAPFIVFMLALCEWSLASAIQIGFTDVAMQHQFGVIGFVGATIVPTAWLVLVVRYTRDDWWLSRKTIALLAIVPVVTITLVFTSQWHGLIWRSISMSASAPIPYLDPVYGPWYWINLGYSYFLVTAGLAALVRVYHRSSHVYRRQAGTLIVGAVVPLGANVAFTFGASPVPGLDLTTSTFALTGVFFALALFRFDLLDLAPMARQQMIDELGDGIVVLDADERIVEYNPNAWSILDGEIEVGWQACAALPGDSLEEVDGTVLTNSNGTRRFYQIRCTPLRDYRDELAGYLIGLREITDQKEYEQRLEVANRLLRHNLRNEANLIIGHATDLEEELAGPAADRVHAIRKTAERMVDRSSKVRRIETTIGADVPSTTVDVPAVVGGVVDRFADAYPAADVSITAPSTAAVTVVDADLLDTAVANLIENAIEHGDDLPSVTVSVETGDPVSITVADDGPGIPAMERDVIDEGRETSLQHGSGVGLWLVHWIVTASGGEVHFEESSSGSVVRIDLPAAHPENRSVER